MFSGCAGDGAELLQFDRTLDWMIVVSATWADANKIIQSRTRTPTG